VLTALLAGKTGAAGAVNGSGEVMKGAMQQTVGEHRSARDMYGA
jgi:hypothetical protein